MFTLFPIPFSANIPYPDCLLIREENQCIVYYNIAVETNDGEAPLELEHIVGWQRFTVNQTLEDGLCYTNRNRQPRVRQLTIGTLQLNPVSALMCWLMVSIKPLSF
ncbi:hypothetical protein OH492_27105 [Vibrio chagasii]|nr:hypothetical protein [Vibrio chagasii]